MEREIGNVAADIGLRAFRYLSFPPLSYEGRAARVTADPPAADPADPPPVLEAAAPAPAPVAAAAPPAIPATAPPAASAPAFTLPAPSAAAPFAPDPETPAFVMLGPPGMPEPAIASAAPPPAPALGVAPPPAPAPPRRLRRLAELQGKTLAPPPRPARPLDPFRRYARLEELAAELAARGARPRGARRREPPG